MESIANRVIADLTRYPEAQPTEEQIAVIPTSFENIPTAPMKLQQHITHIQYKVDRHSMMSKMTQVEQTLLTSCAQTGASLLFQIIPSEPRMQVTNDEFAHKMAQYLNCPALGLFSATQSSKCRSCGFITDSVLAPQHFLNCPRGGGPQRRHDTIRDVFASMFRSGHLPTRIEVRAELPHSGQGGPDIVVQDFPNPGQTTLFDVAIINPVQKHLLSKAAGKGLHAASIKEKEKVDSHRRTADAMGARIAPLIFETSGAFGQTSLDTINSFGHHYVTKFGQQPPSGLAVFPATIPSVYWKHIIAVAHTKGTYAMFRAMNTTSTRAF